MSTGLTIEEMRDLTRRLNWLNEHREAQERASMEQREANRRWNVARDAAATVWASIVQTYGEENAPRWIESVHGSRPLPAASKGDAA